MKQETVTNKSGRINLNDETVLYSLESNKSKPLRSEMRPRVRKHNVITIEEQAEKQTIALREILEDIAQKEKDKENRTKEMKNKKKINEEMEANEAKRRAKLSCVRTLYTVNSTTDNKSQKTIS